MYFIFNWYLILTISLKYAFSSEESCDTQTVDGTSRYILYNVNPGEGFNLRRDVYVRVANLVRKLNSIEPWVLVLPPWGGLYHWQSTSSDKYFPWNYFFDLESLQKWIPVMELEDFMKSQGAQMEMGIILQNFKDMWEREWEDRYMVSTCSSTNTFKKSSNSLWRRTLYGQNLYFSNTLCLSFMGPASTLIPYLTKDTRYKSVFVDHAEILLHDEFGGKNFWSARRSMRFSPGLISVGKEFRQQFLESGENEDSSEPKDSDSVKSNHDFDRGGPYVAVHLRRRDFVRAREKEVPTLDHAANQLRPIMKKFNLTKLFVASDAPKEEIKKLRSYLKEFSLLQFSPSEEFHDKYGDGGAAIVDQIICSHARFFIGSYESTFSFRIQEEREILGFDSGRTFNRLCGGGKSSCDQPTRWTIV